MVFMVLLRVGADYKMLLIFRIRGESPPAVRQYHHHGAGWLPGKPGGHHAPRRQRQLARR
jgi:hypothetical protein